MSIPKPHSEPESVVDMEEALAFAQDIVDRDKYGPRPQAVARALIAAYKEIEVQSTLAITRDISRRDAFRRVSDLEEQYQAARETLLALRDHQCNGCRQPRNRWGPMCPGMTSGDATHYHSPEWWVARYFGSAASSPASGSDE